MPITEAERSEMVNELSVASNPKTVETLVKCVLPDSRDHLATKDDFKVLEHSLRADFAELKAEFAELKACAVTVLAKQTQLFMMPLVGFTLIWATSAIYLATYLCLGSLISSRLFEQTVDVVG